MERVVSKALVEQALWLLKKAGATQAEVKLALSNKQELNLANNEMSLYLSLIHISEPTRPY